MFSRSILNDIGQSAYGILLIGENIKRTADEISKVTALEIDATPTESMTVSKAEITDLDSSKTGIDDPEVPQSVSGKIAG